MAAEKIKFDQSPHPLIEDHYHIQELIQAQQKRANDRTKYQNQKKQEDSFRNTTAGFKDIEVLDFWCDTCGRDFVARAAKQVDSWQELAYYKTKHRCGTWAIRHITDRVWDAYFFRSKKVAYDRMVNAINMLQSFETGYNTIYGKYTRKN